MLKTIAIEVEECDYRDICEAIAKRQAWRVMPDGEGNLAGRVVAEICRGWMENMPDQEPREDWRG